MERDERKGGDNRKWDMSMEGIVGAKPKAPAKESNQESAPTKKVKFEHLSVSPKSVDKAALGCICTHSIRSLEWAQATRAWSVHSRTTLEA